MIRHAVIASWACLSGLSFAQQSEVPQHHLSILTVGDPPPFVQEVRNGVRYEVAPPIGSIPPALVKIALPTAKAEGDPAKAKEEEKVKTPPLRVRLGQQTLSVAFPAPKTPAVEIETEDGAKWLDLPLHPSGTSLAIVRRGKDWTTGQPVVVADDAAARAAGNVHFANLAAFPIGVTFGKEKIRLNPGMILTRRTDSGSSVPLEISYFTADGQVQLCHSASLEPMAGVFRRVVIYSADSKTPRNPIKVIQMEIPSNEPAPPRPVASTR